MLITCWSSKGGSGTTVVAAAIATLLADQTGSALLVDLAGDLPAALGLADPPGGLTGWQEGDDLGPLELETGPRLRLLPRGQGDLPLGMGAALAAAVARRGTVVVDAGVITGGGPAIEVALVATESLLVVRPCFLALRRAVAAPLRPSGVVLVEERERALGPTDVETALGVPVVAVVPWDPAVARRVDAGLLASALPRGLARALRHVGEGQSPSPPAPLRQSSGLRPRSGSSEAEPPVLRGGGPRPLPPGPPPSKERPSAALGLLAGGAGCGPSVGGQPPTPPSVADRSGRSGPRRVLDS